jgi:capsular polysaccharide biosynthesis protein
VNSSDRRKETLLEYGRVLRRSKWAIVAAAILVPLAVVGISLTQSPLYKATTEVLLTRQNVPPTATDQLFPNRFVQQQANLARDPRIATGAVRAAQAGITGQELLDNSEVIPSRETDLLEFSVTNRHPTVARRLVSAYAALYTSFRTAFNKVIQRGSVKQLKAQLADLRAKGDTGTPLYRGLNQQLSKTLATRTTDAFVIQKNSLDKVRPLTARNALFGLVLGLALGIGIALLRQAFDRRVRSSSEVASILGVPVLGRIPGTLRPVPGKGKPAAGSDAEAEALRLLRLNVEAFALDRGPTTILLTSPTPDEGKTVIATNLALELAQSGARVLLVALDPLGTSPKGTLGYGRGPGVTDVLDGRTELAEAITTLENTTPEDAGETTRLALLVHGTTPAAEAELYANPGLVSLLGDLRTQADLILIDGPSSDRPADLIALCGHVDAVLVVTDLRAAQRPSLQELRRALDALPAEVIGVAVIGADRDEDRAPVDYQAMAKRSRKRAPA